MCAKEEVNLMRKIWTKTMLLDACKDMTTASQARQFEWTGERFPRQARRTCKSGSQSSGERTMCGSRDRSSRSYAKRNPEPQLKVRAGFNHARTYLFISYSIFNLFTL